MFQGIVHFKARLVSMDMDEIDEYGRLVLKMPTDFPIKRVRLGDSIAVDGVCLTVVNVDGMQISFDLLKETLRATRLIHLNQYPVCNIEQPCSMGDALHGHPVSGHVDAVVDCVKIEGENHWFSLPPVLAPMIVSKGSISINGVSLTIGEVLSDRFCVYLIPKTLELTNLTELKPSFFVNIEVDMMARYIVNYMKTVNLNLNYEKNSTYSL